MDKKKLTLVLLLLSAPVFADDLTITVQKANGQIVIHEASNAWSASFPNAAAVRAWVLSKDPNDSDMDVMMKALIKSVAQSDVNLAQTYQNKVYTVTVPDPTVVAQ